jgi:subtilisin family serine protease
MKKYFSALLSLAFICGLQALPVMNQELRSLLQKKGGEEITVIASFRSPVYKNLGKETSIEVQKRKMRDSSLAQADLLQDFSLNKTSQVKKLQPLWVNNSVIITGSSSLLQDLVLNEKIESLVLDYEIKLEEPIPAKPLEGKSAKFTYGLEKIRAVEVWKKLGITGKGVTVGLLDTGYASHPDLDGKVVKALDFISSKPVNQPNDGHGHGTHCLGTIGGGNSSGKAIGVAPDVKFIVGKIFSDEGRTKSSAILIAMQWMADPDGNVDTADQPRVVSNSWGGPPRSMAQAKPQWEAVNTWREMGIVPVFAAGNSGPRKGSIGTPGGFPHAFAIGATDSKDEIASFSSRGSIKWEGKKYIKPDVSAPGVKIYSAKHSGGYTAMSGTSMATPHVAGVVALMLQADPKASVSRIEEILEQTSIDLGPDGKDNAFGFGRVDAFKAVSLLANATQVTLKISSPFNSANVRVLPDGEFQEIAGSESLSFSLAPGSYDFEVTGFGALDKTVRVKLGPDEKKTVEVELEKAPSFVVNFQVRDKNNRKIIARVLLQDSPVPASDTYDGSLSLELPSGDYRAVLSSRGFAKAVKSFQVKDSGIELKFTLEEIASTLVVADLTGEIINLPPYYHGALSKLGLEFDNIKLQSADEPLIEADLLGYETLIWFTGRTVENALSEAEQDALDAYLWGGGKLILSGQGISKSLGDSRFAKDVLGAVYKKEKRFLRGIQGQGLKLKLNGQDSADNQFSPDALKLSPPKALGLLKYSFGGLAGIEHTYGRGQSIFLGFGIEGVRGEDNRVALLKTLLKRLKPRLRERLDRLQFFYKTAPDLHRILAQRIKVSDANRSEIIEYLKSVDSKAPYRSLLADLQK